MWKSRFGRVGCGFGQLYWANTDGRIFLARNLLTIGSVEIRTEELVSMLALAAMSGPQWRHLSPLSVWYARPASSSLIEVGRVKVVNHLSQRAIRGRVLRCFVCV